MIGGRVVGVLHVLDAGCRDVQLAAWSNLLGEGALGHCSLLSFVPF